MASIFTPQELVKYAETRLFGSNVTADMVDRIELHNGVLPSLLEKQVLKGDFERVEQENGREPIYFKDGTLFIPQYSGFGRETRYRRMIEEYLDVSGRDIAFDTKFLNDEPRDKNIYYENHAYDFVVGLFVPDEKYEDRRVFPDMDVTGIRKIVFGPLDEIAKQADEVVARNDDNDHTKYLDVQIVKIKGQDVLNIGYVYADQANHIIFKMLREYAGIAEKEGNKLDIDIYMFGRVGGLADNLKRHSLVYPTGVLDAHGKLVEYDNILAPADEKGRWNFNVHTVFDETMENLKQAKRSGCVCVELEEGESLSAVNKAREWWSPRLLNIRFGFVGYVSDMPLKNDTLADELDSDRGERDAAAVITKTF